MATSRDADHALGLELQLEELVEQRERARVQGRTEDMPPIEKEIEALQNELAASAEAIATADVDPPVLRAPHAGGAA